MRPLSAPELLSVWERGLNQSLAQRALLLLAAACSEIPPEALVKLSLGQRDARLLTLREWTFGPQVVSLATCPACGDRLELTFNVAEVRMTPIAAPAETLSLELAGYAVSFRLPGSFDLPSCRGPEDVAATKRLLLERCLLAVQHRGERVDPGQLPPAVIDEMVEQMAQADPQADIRLDLCCPACQHHWQALFDIASFFWSELTTWAYHTLRDVHILASAYGWSEAEILALSPWRRQIYLDMVYGVKGKQ